MAGLSVGGLGSGLPVDDLVQQLTDVQRQSRTAQLDRRESSLTSTLSGLGTLKGSLSSFKSTLDVLKDSEDFKQRKATLSKGDFFSVTATSAAQNGDYSVRVESLAQSDKLMSSAVTTGTTLASGSLELSMGGSSFSLTLDGTATLESLRNAINSDSSNPGITATIINESATSQRLVLTSDETGSSNDISVTATGDSDGNDTDAAGLSMFNTNNMTEVRSASDAQIRIDGAADGTGGIVVNSSTNLFTNVIDGINVTVTDKMTADDDPITLTVGSDKQAVKDKIMEFVTGYNSLRETISSLNSVGESSSNSGLLVSDSTLRSIDSTIRRTVSNSMGGSNLGLAEIGITLDERGQFKVDDQALDDALSADFEGVGSVFSDTTGLASALSGNIDSYTRTGGILSTRMDSINGQLTNLDETRTQVEARITAYQARIQQQFIAMDILVGQLNNTSSYLEGQFDALPGVVKSNKN